MAKHVEDTPEPTRADGITDVEPVRRPDHATSAEHVMPADRTTRADDVRAADRPRETVVDGEARARDKFGGLNIGAAVFGWIVAVGVAVLLAGVVGAVLTAVGSSIDVTQTAAEREAGTIALSTAIVLLALLAAAYYAGGYVAGRMSRFDGARQGVGVWIVGLAVTIVAFVLGAVFGDKYNVIDRVDLPRIPFSTGELTWGAVIAAVSVILVTLLFAILGGILGHRYHNRVDRVARR